MSEADFETLDVRVAGPEGNESCLIPVEPFEFDESGSTDDLDGLAR